MQYAWPRLYIFISILWIFWGSPSLKKKCKDGWHVLNPKSLDTTEHLYISKATPVCTPWRVRGAWSTAPRILNLGTRWRWVVSFMPRPLYPWRKSLHFSLNRRFSEFQSRLGFTEKKNIFLLPRIKPRFFGLPTLVQSLHWLRYPVYTDRNIRN